MMSRRMAKYTAEVHHNPPWYSIEITDGLPDYFIGVTQCAKFSEIPRIIRHLFWDLEVVQFGEDVDCDIIIRSRLSDSK